MRGTILSGLLFAATALGGCYASGDVGYQATYSGGAYVSTPDLVTVSPGVQVVADYDEPVFYSDGFYWRYYDNSWYRSNSYYTGWSYWDRPPVAVLRIDRPYAYSHYRPNGYVARNRGQYRRIEPVRQGTRSYVGRPEPVVRERTTVTPGTRTYVGPQQGTVHEGTRSVVRPAPVVRGRTTVKEGTRAPVDRDGRR